jgi:3-deoxy-D-manno-octulosonic-acid transferase
MGDVPLFYAAADVAFVGGTLVPVGGHNLLEPAALGCPVVTGPHLFNTPDIARMFEKLGASIIVNDAESLAGAVTRLLTRPAEAAAMGDRGRQLVQANRGSLARLLTLVNPLIPDDD